MLLPHPRKAVLRMLESIGAKENVSKFLEEVLSSPHNARCECTHKVLTFPLFFVSQKVKGRKKKLMGFGHRIYKNYDPRAAIIKKTAYEVPT